MIFLFKFLLLKKVFKFLRMEAVAIWRRGTSAKDPYLTLHLYFHFWELRCICLYVHHLHAGGVSPDTPPPLATVGESCGRYGIRVSVAVGEGKESRGLGWRWRISTVSSERKIPWPRKLQEIDKPMVAPWGMGFWFLFEPNLNVSLNRIINWAGNFTTSYLHLISNKLS